MGVSELVVCSHAVSRKKPNTERSGSNMAKRVTVTAIDDTDGESLADETVRFMLDGVTYEIDLSAKNAKKLRERVQPWIRASRRVSGRKRSRSVRSAKGAELDSAAVREWARRQGREVASRGRIPRALLDAFAESA